MEGGGCGVCDVTAERVWGEEEGGGREEAEATGCSPGVSGDSAELCLPHPGGATESGRRRGRRCVLTHSYPHMRCPLLSSDYQLSAVIDCETAMDVDDGWVLSGVHRSPTPHASIISASLPLNGDYSPYIEACESLVPFNCEHIKHTLKQFAVD